tara:strand:- start:295 stop:1536 length:1242 start_codon:yes stop_codon:yes gene_type:complete
MLNENTNSYNIEFIRSQFPALNVRVWNKRLSYLDSAASMQKPKVVLDNIQENYSSSYSNVHRGLHYLSEKATESYENSRIKVANFINANENEIIFTSGATAAINLVAYSWGNQNLNKNDEIILTIAEHHANFVPWQYIAKSKGAKIKVVHYNPDEDFDLSKIKGLITNKTKLITFPHVSNVLGTVFPVKEICSIAKQIGAVTLVDGCQGAIHFKVDVKELGCDFYCFSGHKLYGPTGIGVLYGSINLTSAMPPFMCGGDMIDVVKINETTYADPPLRFEAGTPPIVQAIALGKAIDWVNEIGLENIEKHEKKVLSYGIDKLNSIKGVKIFGKNKNKAGVISFTMDCAHAHDIATIVDREGVAVRAGHHCAQPLLDAFNIVSTTRASVGAYSDFDDFDQLANALTKVKKIFGAL